MEREKQEGIVPDPYLVAYMKVHFKQEPNEYLCCVQWRVKCIDIECTRTDLTATLFFSQLFKGIWDLEDAFIRFFTSFFFSLRYIYHQRPHFVSLPRLPNSSKLLYSSVVFGVSLSNILAVVTFIRSILLRQESVGIKKVWGQAKLAGTVICIAGAMVMSLYHGPIVNIGEFSIH
ncbi:nodulin MtN21 /EamA-like transporter family protein [Euphorbia peplus]|nr:nodulin MtN21 /EamA-like transporter family protein [Euphorbia peplus]